MPAPFSLFSFLPTPPSILTIRTSAESCLFRIAWPSASWAAWGPGRGWTCRTPCTTPPPPSPSCWSPAEGTADIRGGSTPPGNTTHQATTERWGDGDEVGVGVGAVVGQFLSTAGYQPAKWNAAANELTGIADSEMPQCRNTPSQSPSTGWISQCNLHWESLLPFSFEVFWHKWY